MASLDDVCRAWVASMSVVGVADKACSIGRYDLDMVVGGRTACNSSCGGNMAACGVSAADAGQQQGDCDAVEALPAGAAALVVLSGSAVGVRC